jgi:predicted transcriptional regulator
VARKPSANPTEAELAILRVLWQRGPSTVREVHDTLARDREFAYTTTLKLLQLMTAKAVAVREEEGRVHRYRAAVPQQETQQRLVRELLDRAFNGSAAQLVVQALAAMPASPEELREVHRLLAEYEAESLTRPAARRRAGKEKPRG